GVSYYDTVIYPRLLENIKLVFSKYTAEGLIGNRTVLADEACDLIKSELAAFHIDVVSISIEDIDFTDTFTDAVEAKQVAQQNKLTTETQQEAEVIVAKAEAEKKVIAAEADAEQAKIAADAEAYATRVKAEAEAEANRKLAESITQDLINYQQITNWDGKLPTVTGGDSVFPMIDVTEQGGASGQ
ncbi:MAG: prohibitin family protein, partial [Clostridia bacterium]|nr:prohibitin family protein [Clostridia bacterium]